jgi:methylthioxylose transferase
MDEGLLGKFRPAFGAGWASVVMNVTGISRPSAARARSDTRFHVGLRAVLSLGAWVTLVALGHFWGTWLIESGRMIKVLAPPLSGRFDLRLSWRLLPGIALAGATVWLGPRIAGRLRWGALVAVTAILAASWAVALALVDGAEALTTPLTRSSEYLRVVPGIDSVTAFVSTFTERVTDYPIHVQGHPPGMVVVLVGFSTVGLGGPGWAAALIIAGGASCASAAMVAVREIAGLRRARAAAPFLATAPAALWIATSADALFAGVSAWAIALFVLATGGDRRGRAALALASGVLFGLALLLTYGVVVLASVAGAVSLWRGKWRPLLLGGVGSAMVLGAAALLGFSWLSGLRATEALYRAGISSSRPYGYFVVNNLSAFALAVGPATAVALARLRRSPLAWIIGGGLMAVAVADLSGLSKGEVERIWLPFVPWVAAAMGLLRPPGRALLVLQVATGLSIAALVRTPW